MDLFHKARSAVMMLGYEWDMFESYVTEDCSTDDMERILRILESDDEGEIEAHLENRAKAAIDFLKKKLGPTAATGEAT